MIWEKYTGDEVDPDEKVLCALKHYNTGEYTYCVCIRVDELDCDWKTADDFQELNFDWSVTHFMRLEEPSDGR